jgi:hypothetical protein
VKTDLGKSESGWEQGMLLGFLAFLFGSFSASVLQQHSRGLDDFCCLLGAFGLLFWALSDPLFSCACLLIRTGCSVFVQSAL